MTERLVRPQAPPQRDTLAKRFVRTFFRRETVLSNDSSSRTDPDRGSEKSADASVEMQSLSDLIVLLKDMLDAHEVRAAVVFLGSFASSEIADAKLTCTPSAFKQHLTNYLNNYKSEVSREVVQIVHQCTGEAPKVSAEATAKRRTASVDPTAGASSTSASTRNSRPVCRRAKSMPCNMERCSTNDSAMSDATDSRSLAHSNDRTSQSIVNWGQAHGERSATRISSRRKYDKQSHGPHADGGGGDIPASARATFPYTAAEDAHSTQNARTAKHGLDRQHIDDVTPRTTETSIRSTDAEEMYRRRNARRFRRGLDRLEVHDESPRTTEATVRNTDGEDVHSGHCARLSLGALDRHEIAGDTPRPTEISVRDTGGEDADLSQLARRANHGLSHPEIADDTLRPTAPSVRKAGGEDAYSKHNARRSSGSSSMHDSDEETRRSTRSSVGSTRAEDARLRHGARRFRRGLRREEGRDVTPRSPQASARASRQSDGEDAARSSGVSFRDAGAERASSKQNGRRHSNGFHGGEIGEDRPASTRVPFGGNGAEGEHHGRGRASGSHRQENESTDEARAHARNPFCNIGVEDPRTQHGPCRKYHDSHRLAGLGEPSGPSRTPARSKDFGQKSKAYTVTHE